MGGPHSRVVRTGLCAVPCEATQRLRFVQLVFMARQLIGFAIIVDRDRNVQSYRLQTRRSFPKMSKSRLFAYTFFASLAIMLGVLYYQRGVHFEVKEIDEQTFLAPQLTIRNIDSLRRVDYSLVVCIRPDGEDADQTPSSEIAKAVKRRGFKFAYIPVPHESIPEEAVKQLGEVLGEEEHDRTLLYCRTGRRAVRLYAMT